MSTSARILVVDDDPDLLRLVTIRLEGAGYQVTAVESAERALAQVAVTRPALVLTDLRMGGMDGLALFDAVRRAHPTLPVIILTAHGTIPDAVEATRRGVFGYLTKPVDAQSLLSEVARALAFGAAGHAQAASQPDAFDAIVTRSSRMQELVAKARLAAPTEASILMLGPSGSGKQTLARAIHAAGPRAGQPFTAIRCAAIPGDVLEKELFGAAEDEGANASPEAALGGTLYLDDIDQMPLELQAKLLRLLPTETGNGNGEHRPARTRVISASTGNIEQAVAEGAFRADLYYRLKVVNLRLPSLAERRDDIPLLAQEFLRQFAQRDGRAVNGFAPGTMEVLVNADWPGNVRQLRNVVEQAVAVATGALVPASSVEDAIADERRQFTSLEDARRRFEHDYLVQLLKLTSGNVTHAARMARRNRTEFYKLLQRHKLEPSAFKALAR
jgi:two-component system response regulator GlrR